MRAYFHLGDAAPFHVFVWKNSESIESAGFHHKVKMWMVDCLHTHLLIVKRFQNVTSYIIF